MGQIVLGVYTEGSTDSRFLPIIVRRTSLEILAIHNRTDFEVLDPFPIPRNSLSGDSLAERIMRAAKKAYGYHALIVHSDADSGGYDRARSERFDPGYALIQREMGEICKELIPLIPVRMVEAWMLADIAALQKVLDRATDINKLNLPQSAKRIEDENDPKAVIRHAIQQMYPGRSRYWPRIMGQLYEQLAPIIALEQLKRLPSYQYFVRDLTNTFRSLNLVQ